MTHLTPEELLDCHYDECTRADAPAHLAACPECSHALAALREDLAAIVPNPVPARVSNYGELVWARLHTQLTPQHNRYRLKLNFKFHFNLRPRFAFAAAASLILVIAAAFFAGSLWQKHTSDLVAHHAEPQPRNPQAAQRVILLVLSDHLDQSERLLTELNHPSAAADDPALQSKAQELLTENRLYRQSVTHLNTPLADPAITTTLDHFERVLAEVANSPKGLSRAEILRLQKEMNTSGLLIEVRVLRSRVHSEQSDSGPSHPGGTA